MARAKPVIGRGPEERDAPEAPAPARGRRRHTAALLALAGLAAAVAWVARTVAPTDSPPLPPPQAGPTRAVEPPPPERLYRWRDEAGSLHLTPRAPPEGTPVEAIPIRRDPPAPVADWNPTPAPPPAGLLGEGPFAVYTPAGLRRLAEQIAETQRRLGERDRLLQDLGQELAP
jgi:hypothetical protein